jgi:hypothetical protein
MYVIGVLAVFETSNAQSPYFENNILHDISNCNSIQDFPYIFYFDRIILRDISL